MSVSPPSPARSPPPRIVDAVFEGRTDRPVGRWVAVLLAALLLHVGVIAIAGSAASPLEAWSAALAVRIHADLQVDELVDLVQPPRPPPPPVPPPRNPEARERRADARPSAPAQAGRILAQEESPRAPLDLTGETFVTGTAQTYAGGVTAASGTSKVAVMTREVAPQASGAEPDRSHGVGMAGADWTCPWPPEAEAQSIDEQVAVVRVVVRTDGTVASARVISDPGFGFGRAAVACSLREKFAPATDRDGHPIEAESPPVRVRFTR